MAPWEKQKATETVAATATATPTVEAKPTAEKVQAVEWEQQAVKADTQKDLATLQWEISTTQKSKFDKMNHTNALKNNQEYRKQVEQILGLPWDGSSDYKQLKQDIKTLQEKVKLPIKEQDGALGPRTFNALKVEWDKSQEGNPKPTYKEFINKLMNRPKIDQSIPNPTIQQTEQTLQQSSVSNSVSTKIEPTIVENDKNKFGLHLFDDAKIMVNENTAVNFELDEMIIDRDAYKISETPDGKSYELNIRAKEDNVLINKTDLETAIRNGDKNLIGKTLPKKGGDWTDVKLIMNAEKLSEQERKTYQEKMPNPEVVATASYETPVETTNETQVNIVASEQIQEQTTAIPSIVNGIDNVLNTGGENVA